MGKRYVYWRGPDGKPYTRDDGKHAPQNLLGHIGKSATSNPDGSVSFPDFSYTRWQWVIQSAAAVVDPEGRELNETDSRILITEAIFQAIKNSGGGQTLLAADVLRNADSLAAQRFRIPAGTFVLVASPSVGSVPFRSAKIAGCEITPLRSRGHRYRVVEQLQRIEPRFRLHLESTKYQLVQVRTCGRTVFEAYDGAMTALNLLRGIWNFFGTYGVWSKTLGSTEHRPLGVVHVGPIQTLHHPDGTPVGDLFWFDPAFAGDEPLFDPEGGWQKLEKHRQTVLRRLVRLPYQTDLRGILIRYAVALDQNDLNIALLHLWGILERLTGTTGARYDDTVQRASWGWPDRSVAIDVLQTLRLRRNQIVHSANHGEEPDQAAFLIKQILEPHLLRLMRNEFQVDNLEEYARHLALPSDISEIEKRRKRLSHALKTLKRWRGGREGQG